MSLFSRAVEGQPLRVPAQAYNAAMDVAEWFQTRGRPTGGGPIAGTKETHRLVVDVRNDTGAQLNVGECVSLQELTGASAGLNSSGYYEVNDSPLTLAVLRSDTTTTQWDQPFGVAIEPIPDGEIGKVCVSGLCVATVGAGSSGQGYATPVFTGAGATLSPTSHRGPVRVLQPIEGNYHLVLIESSRWQARRHLNLTGTSYTRVLSSVRGTGAFNSANSDGILVSDETLTSTYSSVITSSIIKVPCDGIYDIRYDVSGRVAVNNGGTSARALKTTNAAETTLTMSRFAVGLEIVILDASNVVQTFAHWPALTATAATRGAEIVCIPVIASSYTGFDYHKYGGGSVRLNMRLWLTTYRKIGLRMSVAEWPTGDAAFVNSEFVPKITLRGTGYIEPATPDIYLDPT